MTKIINSPVKKFPGSITLPDALPLAKVLAFDKAMRAASDLPIIERAAVCLDAIMDCIEVFQIKGQPDKPTSQTFLYTPAAAATDLYIWLLTSVTALVVGEKEIPNDLPPTSEGTPEATAESPQN